MTTILQPPALQIDARLAELGVNVNKPGRKLEQRIVWNLLAHLAAAGWEPVCEVGDANEPCETAIEVMELVFNLDEARVIFAKPGDDGNRHWVFLVLGNGTDIVSDWSYSKRDVDGFNAAMEAFDAEDYC